MWFVWIGNIITALITFFLGKNKFRNLKLIVIIPISIVYIGMMVSSVVLFVTAITYTVNNIFNLLDVLNQANSSNSVPVFNCFLYLLNAMGIAPALKAGVSLIVSDILIIIILKATMAGKNTVKQIIWILDKGL